MKRGNKIFIGDASMKVKIIEVGPRDGLQNEKQTVPTKVKIELINRLAETGIQVIETTSFVSPKWIPQLVDANEVYSEIKKAPGVSYPVLTPNMNGLNRALRVGVREIAIFAAVSETFSRRNINCSIAESFERFEPMVKLAREKGVRIRGYLSCVLGCPFEGSIDPKKVAELTKRLVDMGCYEVSLGDTIGVGTAGSMQALLDEVLKVVPAEKVAIHCHDTYGQALPNILTAIHNGITAFDSSVAGTVLNVSALSLIV